MQNASSIAGWLLALAWVVFVILKVAGVSLQSLRRRRSHSWPWAKTTIEGGTVQPVSQGRGGPVYELTAGYSYAVNGEKYGGAYTECFRIESEAHAVLKSLQELPPPVRYKPGDLSESVMDPYRDAALGLRDG